LAHYKELTNFFLADNLKDTDFINKPIKNYGKMKIIFVDRVPAMPISPTAIHRAFNRTSHQVSCDDP
jgi:hypothetical protein